MQNHAGTGIRLKRTWAFFLIFTVFLLLSGTAWAIENDAEQTEPPPPEADASYEADVEPWNKINLTPGSTYDVGTAKWNTTVYIKQAGTYYLKGESNHCRVEICSGGVNLYLKDGLVIDPNQNAYVGSSTAAISVWDQGGEVRIISEKNAQIYLGGYYYCPAIRKDRHNTKLIFETEDPSQPGTIVAYRSEISHSAAIGSTYRIITDNEAPGNMEFKSGIIKATGGNDSAGIGCGSGSNSCTHMVFSGAEVYATGSGAGAGIGGGLAGGVYNLSITGGKIVAAGDRGAGIGGGRANSSKDGKCGTITITGGDITATSNYASGIGCGMTGSISHIIITGGTIHASSLNKSGFGAGIGGTGANYYGRCGQIDISGGEIYASGGASGGVGIGSALVGDAGDTVINISGGYIEATAGGESGTSIGGGGWGALQDTGHCYVNISGGTILCLPTVGGGGISSRYDLTCTITGGSLFCGSASIKGTPTDGKGNPVKLMNVHLFGCPSKTPVTDASITAPAAGYGLNDVITLFGESLSYSTVYPWLPENTVTEEMTAGGVRLYGSAETNAGSGTLYPATQIILDANCTDAGASNGSAAGGIGQNRAAELTAPIRPGYHPAVYASDASIISVVMNADGTFAPDIVPYTDTAGKWAMLSGETTLYTAWEANAFTVTFNGNAPKTASTAITGFMEDQKFTYAEAQALTANAFSLPGYTFKGWNTKADGTGTALNDGADGSKLCAENAASVTLYAMWEANRYYVRFDPNGGTGTMESRQFTFDIAAPLPPNAFTNGTLMFCGWERELVFGGSYSDGQTVKNLTTVPDGEVTLTAVWREASRVMLDIRLDGVSVPGCAILLKQGDTEFNVPFTYANGLYSYNDTLLPDGEYSFSVNGADTGKTITVSSAGTVTVCSYFTLSITGDAHIQTVTAVPEGTPVPFGTESGWQEGSIFTLTAADTEAGYSFGAWLSGGIDPKYISGTSEKSNPAKIAIQGKTELVAESSPAAFIVRFAGNKPKGASTKLSGQMAEQAFSYGEAQALTRNAYTLPGYLFEGWNTKADGTGTAVENGADGSSLSSENKSPVTLYAVWEPITYIIVFEPNAGTGYMPVQPMTFDQAEPLVTNMFGAPAENLNFDNWNLAPGGTARAFKDGETVVNLADTQGAAVTLYAQWSRWTLFVTDPQDATVLPGEKAAFTVTATGSGKIRYQWQVNRGSGWKDIKGAKAASYTTAPVKLSNDGYRYRCKVSDAHRSTTTNAAILTVSTVPPTGDSNPILLTLCLMLAAGTGLVCLTRRKKS